jgi:predicted secreted protein
MRGLGLTALAIAAASCLPGAALAQNADQQQPVTLLHLSQTAERDVVRDMLRVELRVEETGADPQAIQAAINRRMAAASDRAHQVQGIVIETGYYGVGEERPANAPQRWRGSQSLILTGKDAGPLLKLAGQLQADGMPISSLGYMVSPETVRGAEEDLTAEALAALDRRAAAIAERMHLSVRSYRDLKVGNADEGGMRPMPRMAAMAAAAPPPVAEPGKATVRVTIEAELALGPLRP